MSIDNNKLIKHAQLYWSKQLEPISCEFDDIYFNTEHGLNESLYVFIQGNKLEQRWLECPTEHFSIAETGFGTGLNFLLTCLHFRDFLCSAHDGKLRRLHFTSFEKYPLSKQDLTNALQKWPQLNEFIVPLLQQYPQAITGCHRINIDKFNITLDLWFGDVLTNLPNLYIYDSGLFDCWYLDGFAPSKNPDMWSETLFNLIAKTCRNKATIATFTAAGFVRRALKSAGFNIQKRKGYGKKREMLVGDIIRETTSIRYGQHYRQPKRATSPHKNKDVAIIGGGIASACLTLALLKRGYKVSLYCKDKTFAVGGSGNEQGALYPLLNEQHDALSQLFANAFLFSRNYIELVNQSMPFDFDLSGLLQLYYDPSASKKLDKIIRANLPETIVHHLSAQETDTIAGIDINQQALFYPLGGWLSPKQMVEASFNLAKKNGDLTIHFSHQLNSFSENKTTESNSWDLHFAEKTINHNLLILCTAMNTLNFKQCEAIPLSAARGQVTHIPSNTELKKLKVTLCHEGYLTPEYHNKHCMGATFKRHVIDEEFNQSEQTENKNKLQKCIKDKHWTEAIDVNHTDANVGIRCTTRDHFPYVGAVPDYQATKQHYRDIAKKMNPDNAPFHHNLYMFTGLGSRGLCTAPLLADMLASQINKEPLPFPTAILNAMQGNRQWVNYLKREKLLKF